MSDKITVTVSIDVPADHYACLHELAEDAHITIEELLLSMIANTAFRNQNPSWGP